MQRYLITQINCKNDIESNKEIILGLWKRNLPRLSEDCFDWIYARNPCGAARTVLAQSVETGEYVGCAGVYPRTFSVSGKPMKAGVLINFAVDQKHRVFGPAMMMQKEILNAYLSKDFDLILGYPNKSSEGIFRRLGYSFIGEGNYWSKILDWGSKIKNIVGVEILAIVLGACLDWFCGLFEMIQKIRINSQHSVKNLTEIPRGLDSLWTRFQKQHSVIGLRNEEYLRWRYQGTTNASFKFFSLYNKGKELCAYIVYQQEFGKVTVFDLFAEDVVKSKYVLVLFIGQMRRLKNKSITMVYAGDDRLKRVLRQLCFVKRKDKRALFVALGNIFTEWGKTSLSSPRNWHISEGELDL